MSKQQPGHINVDRPAKHAARKMIPQAMDIICKRIKKLANQPSRGSIHKLRVATRRANTLLLLFRPLTRKPDYRRAKNHLGDLRRSAGLARDVDVFAQRLRSRDKAEQMFAPVLDWLTQRRLTAVAAMEQDIGKHTVRRLRKDCDKLTDHLRWRAMQQESFRELATFQLDTFTNQFHQCASDLATPQLHPLRLVAKKVRYLMEVLPISIRSDAGEDQLPLFVQVQERLGEINDCHVAAEYLDRWSGEVTDKRLRKLFRQLRYAEQELLEVGAKRFRRWWKRFSSDVA